MIFLRDVYMDFPTHPTLEEPPGVSIPKQRSGLSVIPIQFTPPEQGYFSEVTKVWDQQIANTLPEYNILLYEKDSIGCYGENCTQTDLRETLDNNIPTHNNVALYVLKEHSHFCKFLQCYCHEKGLKLHQVDKKSLTQKRSKNKSREMTPACLNEALVLHVNPRVVWIFDNNIQENYYATESLKHYASLDSIPVYFFHLPSPFPPIKDPKTGVLARLKSKISFEKSSAKQTVRAKSVSPPQELTYELQTGSKSNRQIATGSKSTSSLQNSTRKRREATTSVPYLHRSPDNVVIPDIPSPKSTEFISSTSSSSPQAHLYSSPENGGVERCPITGDLLFMSDDFMYVIEQKSGVGTTTSTTTGLRASMSMPNDMLKLHK